MNVLPQGSATAEAEREINIRAQALIVGIAKLEMKPGDVLVVKVHDNRRSGPTDTRTDSVDDPKQSGADSYARH